MLTCSFFYAYPALIFIAQYVPHPTHPTHIINHQAIPGVDATLVGPHDLSCNYGVPEQWTSRTFLDPLDTIIDVSSKFNMGCGIHYSVSQLTNQPISTRITALWQQLSGASIKHLILFFWNPLHTCRINIARVSITRR